MKRFSKSLLLILLALPLLSPALLYAEAGLWLRPVSNAVPAVTLAWNPSPDSTVAGYNIYSGPRPGQYTNRLRLGNVTNGIVSGLSIGSTYFFAATAYTSDNLESDFSNEISYKVPGVLPPVLQSAKGTNLFATITGAGEPETLYAFDRSTDLKSWQAWQLVTSDSRGTFSILELPLETAFYRASRFPIK